MIREERQKIAKENFLKHKEIKSKGNKSYTPWIILGIMVLFIMIILSLSNDSVVNDTPKTKIIEIVKMDSLTYKFYAQKTFIKVDSFIKLKNYTSARRHLLSLTQQD